MPNRLLRPLLLVEFLIALQVVFTVWSQVGGQYHLELMFWPWKLGVGGTSAALIVAITASLVRSDGQITRRTLVFCSCLIVVLAVAGVVTWYYHLNEPADQENGQDEPSRISRIVLPGASLPGASLPNPARVSAAHHR
jgi:glucan phosphoethanolaminetransferase (alkaline phosphatase superfamily)